MSVCLSPRLSQKPHVQISSNFLSMLRLAVARSSSDGNAIRYLLTVLWMTSYFHIWRQRARIKDDTYVSSSSPGDGTWGEVCRLRLHLVCCL